MQDILAIIGKSIDAINQPEGWNELTDLLTETYSLRSSMIFAFPLHAHDRPQPFESRYLRSDGSFVTKRFLEADDTDDLPAYNALATKAPQILYTEADILGFASDAKLPYSSMRDFMQEEAGIQSRLASKLNKSGPWLDTLILHSVTNMQNVPQKVFHDMKLVLPIIAKSLNTYRAFETLKHHFGARLMALDFLAFGAVLVDETGMLLYSNAYASDVLAEKDGVELFKDGRIGFSKPEIARAFSNLVQQACHPQKSLHEKKALTLNIPRRSGEAPYFLKAHALTDSDNETDINFPFALLFLIDPAKSGSLSSDGIDAMKLLTPAETGICNLLLSGMSTNAIAEQRNVSINTVRQQVKSVLSKLGCRSRNQLFHVAITTHLPIKNHTLKREKGGFIL